MADTTTTTHRTKGVSLAKGPVGLLGLLGLLYGITALLFGSHSFSAHPVSGTVNGSNWIGLEVNGWSSLLFVAAGLLLLLGAPAHWGAKSMSLIVGLALGVACIIAVVDGNDVLGIFAANNLTKLVWGAAAVVLLVLSLMPRVGRREIREDDEPAAEPDRLGRRRVDEPAAAREPTPEESVRRTRG